MSTGPLAPRYSLYSVFFAAASAAASIYTYAKIRNGMYVHPYIIGYLDVTYRHNFFDVYVEQARR